jgi:hypothetical protein
VNGDKEFFEKLGRNDPCPCGSGRRFQELLLSMGDFDGSNRDYFFQEVRTSDDKTSTDWCPSSFMQI